MVSGPVICGNTLARRIVWAPEAMAKVIVSAPAVWFAARMASRSEMPSPPWSATRFGMLEVSPFTKSVLLVTMNEAAVEKTMAGPADGYGGTAGAPVGAVVK